MDELRQECIEGERNMGRRDRDGHAQKSRYPQGAKAINLIRTVCYRCGKLKILCPQWENCPGNSRGSAMIAEQARSMPAPKGKAGKEQ